MKKLICIVLSVLLLFAVFPVAATDNGVTVSFTVTFGEEIYAADGMLLASQPLTVPYFDLALYGLTDYYYNPDCYADAVQTGGTAQTADGVVTMLHLLLFATEVYKCGLSPADAGQGYLADSGVMDDYFSVSGNAGSSYLTLWDMQTNLNYFVNRVMPLGREGWLATADQIALHTGDSVQVHGITGAASGTNMRAIQAGDTFDAASVQENDAVSLTLTHYRTNFTDGTVTTEPLSGETVYCAKADNADGKVRTWKQLGVTSKSGTITLSGKTLGAGAYYIASAGSEDKAAGMQNAPAVFRLTVDGSAPVQTVPLTIQGLHEMQVQTVKLYAFSDFTQGTTDLLQGIVPSDNAIRATVPTGDYWLEGFDGDGRRNGGLYLRVTENENTFTVQRVYDLHATNSNFVEDTDYSIFVTVTAPDGSNRRAVCGKADNYGTVRTSCLFLLGDTVKASFVPLGDKAETYLSANAEKVPTINTSLTATLYPQTAFTVTAPAGSTVSAGRFANYYLYTFYEPTAEKTLGDGRIQVSFLLPQERVNGMGSPNFFYRVQNPTGVTYWDFFDPTKTQAVEVTAEQIFRDNETVTSKTVLHNYEQNTYDTADLYLNGTKSGCITMSAGETFSLNAFRNWMAIENFYNAKVALPDMHYRVIDENGSDSELLTVTPDKHNSCQAAVTANGSGTAILLVTYDAMFSTQSYKSGKANQPNLFSAIWPENTGVLVFRIGDDSTIETNMFLNGTGEGCELDAEHDPLYYIGGEGASYTFTPESGCTVSVARPVVTRTMTYKGFTTDGVEMNDDGSVTLTGLLHGRNIVKIEKNGSATYQVITAKQASYTLLDADGEPLGDTPLHAGDTVQIQYSGLYNPVEKMSGVYNHNARIWYKGEDGTTFESVAGGAWGVYDFGGNPERQKLTVTIPADWQGKSYTLSGGVIAMKITGSAAGSHRGVSYGRGMDPNFSAQSGGAAQGMLPDITLPLAVHEHDYVGTVTKEATCTDAGEMTYTCAACGDSYTETIPALGHNYDAAVTDPTCTAGGYTTYTCTRCGDSYTADKTDALGHAFKDTVTPPTCTEKGYTMHACTRCRYAYASNETDALGHSFGEWVIVTEPTTELEGLKERTCVNGCGTKETEVLPKIAVMTVEDKDTNVSLTYPETAFGGEVELNVKQVFDGAAFNLVDLNSEQNVVFDITTTQDGTTVQPNGMVTVRIPVPAGFDPAKCMVYHVSTETSKLEKLDARHEDGYMVFETDHLGCYAIVIEKTAQKLPGDVDGDGQITLKDAALIARYLVGGWNVTVDPETADVDDDGSVTLKDAALIQRYIVGGWGVVLR